MQTSDGGRLGSGCMILFAAPFALAGLFALFQAWTKMSGPAHEADDWLLLVFGLLFSGVGFGLMALALWSKRVAADEGKLKQAHPEQPWMWKPEWAAGRIRSSSRTTAIFAWVFCLFWNAISIPAAVLALPKALEQGEYGALFVLIFPLVGVGLLIWAIRATVRLNKYGVSTLELSTRPGVIGGRLSGTIRTSLPDPPEGGMTVSLSCVRKYRSGKNTRQTLLWEEELTVPQLRMGRGPEGFYAPVEFPIPFDCKPYDDSNPRDRITWSMQARAETPGVDFAAVFDVPVFLTAESSAEAVSELDSPRFGSGLRDAAEAEPPCVERPSPNGGVEFYFPPRGVKGGAVAATVVAMVFTASLGLLVFLHAGLLFWIVWGLFDLVVIYAALYCWFGTTRIRIENGRIETLDRMLLYRWTKSLDCDQVERVDLDVSGSASSPAGAKSVSYKVDLIAKDGSKLNLLLQVKGKEAARAFARRVERALEICGDAHPRIGRAGVRN